MSNENKISHHIECVDVSLQKMYANDSKQEIGKEKTEKEEIEEFRQIANHLLFNLIK